MIKRKTIHLGWSFSAAQKWQRPSTISIISHKWYQHAMPTQPTILPTSRNCCKDLHIRSCAGARFRGATFVRSFSGDHFQGGIFGRPSSSDHFRATMSGRSFPGDHFWATIFRRPFPGDHCQTNISLQPFPGDHFRATISGRPFPDEHFGTTNLGVVYHFTATNVKGPLWNNHMKHPAWIQQFWGRLPQSDNVATTCLIVCRQIIAPLLGWMKKRHGEHNPKLSFIKTCPLRTAHQQTIPCTLWTKCFGDRCCTGRGSTLFLMATDGSTLAWATLKWTCLPRGCSASGPVRRSSKKPSGGCGLPYGGSTNVPPCGLDMTPDCCSSGWYCGGCKFPHKVPKCPELVFVNEFSKRISYIRMVMSRILKNGPLWHVRRYNA